jgi:hypothetical protein
MQIDFSETSEWYTSLEFGSSMRFKRERITVPVLVTEMRQNCKRNSNANGEDVNAPKPRKQYGTYATMLEKILS